MSGFRNEDGSRIRRKIFRDSECVPRIEGSVNEDDVRNGDVQSTVHPVGAIDGTLDRGRVKLRPEDVDALLLEEFERKKVGERVAALV